MSRFDWNGLNYICHKNECECLSLWKALLFPSGSGLSSFIIGILLMASVEIGWPEIGQCECCGVLLFQTPLCCFVLGSQSCSAPLHTFLLLSLYTFMFNFALKRILKVVLNYGTALYRCYGPAFVEFAVCVQVEQMLISSGLRFTLHFIFNRVSTLPKSSSLYVSIYSWMPLSSTTDK